MFDKIIKRLKANDQTLIIVDLSGTVLTKLQIWQLALALKNNKTVSTLILKDTKLDADNLEILLYAVTEHPLLDTVDLSNNPLGNKKTKNLLHDFLLNRPQLVELVLANTGIDDEVGQILAEAVAQNASLKFLNATGNRFTDKTATAMAAALCLNPTLRILNLEKNAFSQKSCFIIDKLMTLKQENDPKFHEVNAARVAFFNEALQTLLPSVAFNKTIQLKERIKLLQPLSGGEGFVVGGERGDLQFFSTKNNQPVQTERHSPTSSSLDLLQVLPNGQLVTADKASINIWEHDEKNAKWKSIQVLKNDKGVFSDYTSLPHNQVISRVSGQLHLWRIGPKEWKYEGELTSKAPLKNRTHHGLPHVTSRRDYFQPKLLDDGKLLISYSDSDGKSSPKVSTEIWDNRSGQWKAETGPYNFCLAYPLILSNIKVISACAKVKPGLSHNAGKFDDLRVLEKSGSIWSLSPGAPDRLFNNPVNECLVSLIPLLNLLNNKIIIGCQIYKDPNYIINYKIFNLTDGSMVSLDSFSLSIKLHPPILNQSLLQINKDIFCTQSFENDKLFIKLWKMNSPEQPYAAIGKFEIPLNDKNKKPGLCNMAVLADNQIITWFPSGNIMLWKIAPYGLVLSDIAIERERLQKLPPLVKQQLPMYTSQDDTKASAKSNSTKDAGNKQVDKLVSTKPSAKIGEMKDGFFNMRANIRMVNDQAQLSTTNPPTPKVSDKEKKYN